MKMTCPGCIAADVDDPRTIEIDVDRDPGDRDNAPSLTFSAAGCWHVERSDEYRQDIFDEIDWRCAVASERHAQARDDYDNAKVDRLRDGRD